MINQIENMFYLSSERYRLLNLRGNCGRSLRRFLQRVVDKGLLIQSFDKGDLQPLGAEEFESLQRQAEDVRDAVRPFLREGVRELGLSVDQGYGFVSNSYRVEIDVATATLAQLRDLVTNVVVLAEGMFDFVAKREATPLELAG